MALVLLAGAALAAASPAAAATNYRDPQGRFTITIANGWTPLKGKGDGAWKAPQSPTFFGLSATSVPRNATSMALLQAVQRDASDAPDFELLGSGTTRVGNQNQPYIEYTLTNNEGDMVHAVDTVAVYGTIGWVLTLVTVADEASDFRDYQAMMASFNAAGGMAAVATPGRGTPVATPARGPAPRNIPVAANASPLEAEATFYRVQSAILAVDVAPPPTGTYGCFAFTGSLQGGSSTRVGQVVLASDTMYTVEGGGGTYTYDPATNAVQFTSGPWSGDGYLAVYQPGATPAIQLTTPQTRFPVGCALEG